MMRIANSRRPGLSLTEVLVTLFVMALGIISLMTLFPLGAMQMGQALRDDRCGQTAHQADGITRLWWQTRVVEAREPKTGTLTVLTSPTIATLTMNPGHGLIAGQTADVSWSGGSRTGVMVAFVSGNDIVVNGGPATPSYPPTGTVVSVSGHEDNFFLAMDNPNQPLAALATHPARGQNQSSYPVFIDPIGWYSRSLGQREWISVLSSETRIPRRNVLSVSNLTPQAIRACSMMDDITFKDDGTPDNFSGSSGASVVREGAYNWCAVIQRPDNSSRYVADLKVLVFHTKGLYGGHIPGSAPTNAEMIYSTTSTPPQLVAPTAGSTRIELNVAIANLPIRSGSWIMDGSNATVANFYRIQSITEAGATSTILELDIPLKSDITQLYILRGLADVFDRPQLTGTVYSRQTP